MKNILALTSLFFLLFTLGSCYKKQDTIAVIQVLDASGQRVSGANVKLYASGSQGYGTVNFESTTNSEGEAKFNLNDIYQSGQAGVAVLDIEVTKGTDVAMGIIKVEQEETTKEVININI